MADLADDDGGSPLEALAEEMEVPIEEAARQWGREADLGRGRSVEVRNG
jgi:hypothetical protein